MKLAYYFSFILLISFSGLAQDFSGKIVDSETKHPLENVEVYFPELSTGTVTNALGEFTIDHFSQKKIHIQISYLGYKGLDVFFDLIADNNQIISLQEDHFELDEVSVSKSTGKLQSENTVAVVHKKLSELQLNSPLTLSESLTNISGVEMTTTGVGIGKPIIRGLSGNRIVTYSQGIRVENQQWGDEHGLGIGNVGIEGVEVIKGPASLLYGSDALGGVLYFIDDRYAKHNQSEGFFQTKFNSATLGTSSSLGYKVHKNHLKLNVFGGYTSHADYETPNFGKIYNTRFDEKTFKTSFGFNLKNWISNVRYSYLSNNFGIVEDAIYSNSTDRNFEIPYQSIDNHAITFDNVFFTGDSKLDVKLGYTFNDRREYEEHHDHDDHDEEVHEDEDHEDEEEYEEEGHAMGLDLGTYTYNIKWSSEQYANLFDVAIGTQGMYQKNRNTGEEILIPDATTVDYGVFALTNFDFEALQLQLGGRFDQRQLDTQTMISDESSFEALNKTYSGASFSGGLVYQLDQIKLRANVATGFRAPNLSELLSDGSHGGTNRYEKGNRNLTNESAVQTDFSLSYKNEHFELDINPFLNSINNYIYITPTDEVIDGKPVFQYVQKDAVLYGGEIGVHYHPHAIHWMHLEADFSTVLAEDKNGEALPLIPQTKINTLVRAEISQNGGFRMKSVFVQYVYKFEQERVSSLETQSDAYGLVNMGVSMQAFDKKAPLDIEIGVKNVFNTEYIDHLSRFKTLGIPNIGMNAYIGLKYNFGYKIK